MKILLSNDDGYLARGLIHLAMGLSSIAGTEVTVIAPDRNQSGVSNSLTLDCPLHIGQAENGFFHVDGTPTDCVHLAMTGFLQTEWDMVISGINEGKNLGDDVLYSGTLAAAMEGRFFGLPAIAVSLVSDQPTHFETAVRVVQLLLTHVEQHSVPPDTLLNVNVPDVPWQNIGRLEVTRLGDRHKAGPLVTVTDPRGRTVHWVGPSGPERDAGPGTDFFAIKNNNVSITPIQLDLTKHVALNPVSSWVDKIRWN